MVMNYTHKELRKTYLERRDAISARIGMFSYWFDECLYELENDDNKDALNGFAEWYDLWLYDMDEFFGEDTDLDDRLLYELSFMKKHMASWNVSLHDVSCKVFEGLC